jgi:hypothetical protein
VPPGLLLDGKYASLLPMTLSKSRKTSGQVKNLKLDEFVLVECRGKRRIASQDRTGKWRTLSRWKELKGVVEVIERVDSFAAKIH